MIKVYVQFMVYLPSLPELTLGKKIIPVEIKEGATLGELLEELVNIYGLPLAQAIYDPRRKALLAMKKLALDPFEVLNMDKTEGARE